MMLTIIISMGLFSPVAIGIHVTALIIYLAARFGLKARRPEFAAVISWVVLEIAWLTLVGFKLVPGFRLH